MLKLLEHIISQNLLKFSSQSSAAGIRSYLSVIGKAFVLTVDGFSDSLQKLVELTIDEIKSSVKDIKKTNFDTSKQIMKQNLQNFLLSAQNAGVDLFEEVLNHNHFCRHDVYLNLADVLLKELQTFSDRFFKAIKVQALSQGNITNEKTLQIMEIFRTKFNIKPLQLRKYPRSRAYQIPYGTNMIRMSSFATDDENSFSIDFYQIGRGTYRTVGLVQLLATILDEEAFDFLRTKEQLGYSVSVSFRETKGIVGIAVMLQSQEKKHNFKKISERMEFFMKEIASKKIREMTDDEFKDYKESKIKSLAVQRNTMFGEFHANWSEITKQRYLFNSHEIQAKITQNISKIEFQSFFETCFKPEKIRKLCIQVIGNDQSEASSEKISDSEKFMPKFLESEGNCIEDLYEFQNGLMIYPGRKDLSGDLKK